MKAEEARVDAKTELQVICGVLTTPALMEPLMKIVAPEQFTIDGHRFMWDELQKIHAAGKDLSTKNLKAAIATRRVSKSVWEGVATGLGTYGMDQDVIASSAREIRHWHHIRKRGALFSSLEANLGADNEAVAAILESMVQHEVENVSSASWLRRGSRPMGDLIMADALPEPEEEDVLVEPGLVIRKGVTLLTGPSKAGKSFMVLELARALTRGNDFLQMYPTRGPAYRVAYIQGELSDAQLYRRMAQLKLQSSQLALARVRGSDFRLNTELKYMGRPTSIGAERNLIKLANQLMEKKIDVVIFDPLYTFLEGSELDEVAMKSAFSTLEALSEVTNTAVVLVHHNRKSRPGDQHNAEMASGHSVLHRHPVALMTVMSMQNALNPNAKPRLRLRYQLRCAEPIDDVEIMSKDGHWWAVPWASDSKLMVFEFVRDADRPVKAAEVVKALKGQVGRSQVYQYLKRLVQEKQLAHGDSFFWVPSGELPKKRPAEGQGLFEDNQ